jgi:hypothetical protein
LDTESRSVFRPEAVRRYWQGREEAVLPRFAAPRVFARLWILLGLLLAGALTSWLAEIPVYVSGQALVAPSPGSGPASAAGHVIVALLPPESLSELRLGQPVLIDFDGRGTRHETRISSVEQEVMSPAVIRERFALDETTAPAVTRPAAVIVAPLDSWPAGLDPGQYAGGIYEVNVTIGSRQLVSLFLPFEQ